MFILKGKNVMIQWDILRFYILLPNLKLLIGSYDNLVLVDIVGSGPKGARKCFGTLT